MTFGIETSLYFSGGKGLQFTLKINSDTCLRWGTQPCNEPSPTQKKLKEREDLLKKISWDVGETKSRKCRRGLHPKGGGAGQVVPSPAFLCHSQFSLHLCKLACSQSLHFYSPWFMLRITLAFFFFLFCHTFWRTLTLFFLFFLMITFWSVGSLFPNQGWTHASCTGIMQS